MLETSEPVKPSRPRFHVGVVFMRSWVLGSWCLVWFCRGLVWGLRTFSFVCFGIGVPGLRV